MGNKKNEPEKKKKLTLIEIVIILAVVLLIGNFIYWFTNWREAFEAMKEIGVFAAIALFFVLYYMKKWIEN